MTHRPRVQTVVAGVDDLALSCGGNFDAGSSPTLRISPLLILALSLSFLAPGSMSAQTRQGYADQGGVAWEGLALDEDAALQAVGWAMMLAGCAMVGAVLRRRCVRDVISAQGRAGRREIIERCSLRLNRGGALGSCYDALSSGEPVPTSPESALARWDKAGEGR
jgi:hypothetical protein